MTHTRRRIAVVEDNADNRLLLSCVLSEQYDLAMYEDGLSALTAFFAAAPDLVLLDLSLPDVSGEEVVRAMRAAPALQAVPFIAVTANAMQGDRERFLAAGCTDYISKPIVDLRGLRDRIAALLSAA